MAKKKSLSNHILNILSRDPIGHYNAITIDRILTKKMRYNKSERKKALHLIRKECIRLEKKGLILKREKGFYSLRITTKNLHLLENPPTTIHGLKLETSVLKSVYYQKRVEGIPGVVTKNILETWMDSHNFEATFQKRRFKRIWWEGRDVTITIHECYLIEIWVKSSENPLGYVELIRLKEYLHGFLHNIADFRNVMVRQAGVNKDYRQLRLEGISSVSLRVFTNALSRIYYKESIGAVRIEQHWKGKINFEDVISLIASVNAPRQFVKQVKGQEKLDVWDEGFMFS